MIETEINEQILVQQTREVLSRWSLYRPEHRILARRLGEGKWWIGYRTDDSPIPFTTHLDLNLIGDTLYLVHIWLNQSDRGQHHGYFLYRSVEVLASSLRCRQVRQTPSGWTVKGETRMRYLSRRGWIRDGAEVYKRVSNDETDL